VVLAWFEVSRWETEPEGTAEKRLQQQVERNSRWRVIADEFNKQYRLVSVRRPASMNGQFDLYILAYFGHWWVGIYTQLQEG
jgi:hypothetical protein